MKGNYRDECAPVMWKANRTEERSQSHSSTTHQPGLNRGYTADEPVLSVSNQLQEVFYYFLLLKNVQDSGFESLYKKNKVGFQCGSNRQRQPRPPSNPPDAPPRPEGSVSGFWIRQVHNLKGYVFNGQALHKRVVKPNCVFLLVSSFRYKNCREMSTQSQVGFLCP